jgi:hypothetical protein
MFLLYNICSAGCCGPVGFAKGLGALREASRAARAKKIIEIARGGAGLDEVLGLVS